MSRSQKKGPEPPFLEEDMTRFDEVAACCQPGDAERIARIVRDDLLEGCCGQCDADIDMMHRLQKAAEIMEGPE